jgi:hypothetical protein
MVNARTYPGYRCRGRFFGRRVNCERVPMIPAQVVRGILDDPRNIPYLLVWRSEQDGEIKEAVRIVRLGHPPYPLDADLIEVKRTDGSVSKICVIKWSRPRNGGYAILLTCPFCRCLRRALYGWEPGGRYTSSVQICSWRCRRCAGLRYASEGGALVLRSRGSWFRRLEMEYGTTRSDRPEPWYPYVMPSQRAWIGSESGKESLNGFAELGSKFLWESRTTRFPA